MEEKTPDVDELKSTNSMLEKLYNTITKKYPQGKIIAILSEVEAGSKVAKNCRKYGISDATYYKWKAKHEGLELAEKKVEST